MKELIVFGLIGLFLAGCGGSSSSTEEVVTIKITPANAKQITIAINTSLKDTTVLQDVAQDYSPITKSQSFIDTSDNKLLFYCGNDSQQDTGEGSIDLNLAYSLTAVTVDIDFLNCQLTEPLYIDGGYTFETQGNLLSFIANPAEGSLNYISTLDSVNIIDTSRETDNMIDGVLQQGVSFAAPVYSFDATADLSVSSAERNIQLIDWQQISTLNTDSSELQITMSGQYITSEVEGRLTVSTIEPLHYQLDMTTGSDIDQAALLSGVIQITATDSSSVTITILDSATAQLDIDNDGNGTIDDSITVALDELKFMDLIPSTYSML